MVRVSIDNKNRPVGFKCVPLYPGLEVFWIPSFIVIHDTQTHVNWTSFINDLVVLGLFKEKLKLCAVFLVCWRIYSYTEVLIHYSESAQIFQSV